MFLFMIHDNENLLSTANKHSYFGFYSSTVFRMTEVISFLLEKQIISHPLSFTFSVYVPTLLLELFPLKIISKYF